jgi:hypothetical protein
MIGESRDCLAGFRYDPYMAAELEPYGTSDGVDISLSARQISALEQLHALDAGPRLPTDEKYHSNPQIRALQMVYEGKLGGPGRGQGRPTRDQRMSVTLTEYVRENLGKKVTKALERALATDAGERINLDAIKMIVEMEHKEAKLQLSEDRADLDSLSKEELIATLFDLVNDAQTGQVIEATFSEVTPPEAVVAEIDRRAVAKQARQRNRTIRKRRSSTAKGGKRNGGSPRTGENGVDTGGAGTNGRGLAAPDRTTHPNPVTQAALRRAANR